MSLFVKKSVSDNAAAFESLRRYATEAVAQLTVEMAQQQQNYNVPADDVLALIKAVAEVTAQSPWDVWENWALRHAIPVHEIIQSGKAETNHSTLRARLRDLHGYILLGMVMCEECEEK